MASMPSPTLVRAGLIPRIVAFFIDSIFAAPIAAIGIIPIIGQFISICLLMPYWLFRDFGGASIGKRILGLRVVDYNGAILPTGRRVKRNLLFAMAWLTLVLPVIGAFAAAITFVAVSIVEMISIMNRGERFGDRDARALVIDVGATKAARQHITAMPPQPTPLPDAPVIARSDSLNN